MSVIIPTFSRYNLCIDTIDNVLEQSYNNLEVIVVEDGSKSGVKEYIQSLSDERIYYYFHRQRKGLAATRNTGTMKANGKYVAFLDDDCRWLPEKIEEQMKIALKYSNKNIMIVCGTCKIEDGRLVPDVIPDTKGPINKFIYSGVLLPQSCMMILKKSIIDIGGHSEELTSCIDHDIWLKMAYNNFSIDLPEMGLVYYPDHNNSRMHKDLDQRLLGIVQFFSKWESIVINEFNVKSWDIIKRKYYIQTVLTIIEKTKSGEITRDKAQYYFEELLKIFGCKPNIIDKGLLDFSIIFIISLIYYTPFKEKYNILLKNIVKKFLFIK